MEARHILGLREKQESDAHQVVQVWISRVFPLPLPSQKLIVEPDLLAVVSQHRLKIVRHEVGALIDARVEDTKRLGCTPEAGRYLVIPIQLGGGVPKLEEESVDAPEIGDHREGEHRGGAAVLAAVPSTLPTGLHRLQ